MAGAPVAYTDGVDGKHHAYPDWSPDGSKIAFQTSRHAGATSGAGWEIYVTDAREQNRTLIRLTNFDANSDNEPVNNMRPA